MYDKGLKSKFSLEKFQYEKAEKLNQNEKCISHRSRWSATNTIIILIILLKSNSVEEIREFISSKTFKMEF